MLRWKNQNQRCEAETSANQLRTKPILLVTERPPEDGGPTTQRPAAKITAPLFGKVSIYARRRREVFLIQRMNRWSLLNDYR